MIIDFDVEFDDEKMLDDILDFIISEASKNLINNESVDTGELLRSARKEKTIGSASIVWDVPYADFVEFGSEPHMPPEEAIRKWARRKLGDESLTWAIMMKIAREGIDPKPFVRPAIMSAESRYGEE